LRRTPAKILIGPVVGPGSDRRKRFKLVSVYGKIDQSMWRTLTREWWLPATRVNGDTNRRLEAVVALDQLPAMI
jgi:hypothetical protein